MEKFWMFLVVWLLTTTEVSAQVNPVIVNAKNGDQIPAVFVLGESHFMFECESQIMESTVLSDSTKWKIEKSEDDYIIKCKVYTRSSLIDFDATVRILLTLQNGDSIILTAPICVYADVKVLPYPKLHDNSNQLICNEGVGFHATWDYPSYVKMHWRVYGVFEMSVFDEEKIIKGFSGWYDSGDRTKLQYFSNYAETKNLSIKVRTIKTLHRFSKNGKIQTIHLSKTYPSEWEYNCE